VTALVPFELGRPVITLALADITCVVVDVAIIYLVKRFTTLAFVLLDPSAPLDPAPCCSPTYKSVTAAKRDCVLG